MMIQSGHRLPLLIPSVSSSLLPDHPPASPPRVSLHRQSATAGLFAASPTLMHDVNDLSGPIDFKDSLTALTGPVVLLLGLIVLLVAIVRYRKRVEQQPLTETIRAEFEHELADNGPSAENIAEGIKTIIEKHYRIPAACFTTSELAIYLHNPPDTITVDTAPLPPRLIAALLDCLQQCELLRYSGQNSSSAAGSALEQMTRAVIQELDNFVSLPQ